MENDISNLIQKIQVIKNDQYRKHRPELIDGIEVMNTMDTKAEEVEPRASSWEYEKLMRHQRRLIYKRDLDAQRKAEANMRSENNEEDEEARQKLSVKVNFKPVTAEEGEVNQELQKKWNKLSNSLKIQAVIRFIGTLSPYLEDDQVNQLKYLLISSVSNRKINCLADVEYDSEKGILEKIYKVTYNESDGKFELLSKADLNGGISEDLFKPEESKPKASLSRKKIILIKKE
jgi:hypothetical protein